MRKTRPQGFTLIEVMITVAIIAILAAVAYPSYRDYIIRGRLVDATNGLTALRADMERYFQDNRTYATVDANVARLTTPCARGTDASRQVGDGNFQLACVGTPDIGGFVISAVGLQGAVADFEFRVNQADTKSTQAAPNGWGRCTTRWIVRRGQPCN